MFRRFGSDVTESGEKSRGLRAVLIWAAAILCALTTTVASASVIEHTGSNQPDAGEGWELYNYYGGSVAFPITNDDGHDAWAVQKTDAGQELVYSYQLTSDQATQAQSLGWNVDAVLRVVDVDDDPDFAVSVHFAVGATRYDMAFGSTAQSDPIVMLVTSYDGNGLNPVGITYTATGSGYHDYKLVYDPVAGGADLFIDGIERISDYQGNPNLDNTPRVFFGAAGNQGTGTGYYNHIAVEVPEPASAGLLLIGAAGLLRRRRRSSAH
jgi:hypothetical protein